NRPVDPNTAADLLEQIARGVQAFHAWQIYHRDLKPANVLLSGSPGHPLNRCTPKVADFGLARYAGPEGSAGTRERGEVVGTYAYMPPEQITQAAGKAGPRSDVYSMGAILYELLTGIVPLSGLTEETLSRILTEEPKRVRALNPKVPRD